MGTARMRSRLVDLLLTIGVVGILASSLLATAARNVVDPKAVSARIAQSLSDPRVSRFVADRVVLAVVAADSDFLRVRSG